MAVKIALDYDNTYTLDPKAWEYVLYEMWKFQFDIRIVTMRSEEMDPILDYPGDLFLDPIPIIYCDGKPKREVCRELGWEPDVWIDDKPKSIDHGSDLTPEMLGVWRANGRK